MTVKVLDLRDSPWVDGPGRTVLDCAQSLAGSDIQIVVGTFGGGAERGSEYADEAERRGLEVVRIEEHRALDLDVLSQIRQAVAALGIDVLHSHDFRTNFFTLLSRRRTLPIVATVHGWIANDASSKIRTVLDKAILRGFDRIIAVSEQTRERLGGIGLSDQRVRVITNALKTAQYPPISAAERNEARQQLRISPSDMVVSNIGRLSPEKGQALFLDVLAELRDQPVTALLVGEGPDESALRDQAEQLGLGDRLRFLGFQRRMRNIYAATDLVVQSSFTEGMPNVILEALLLQIPVVATDVGGTREVVGTELAECLVAPGSVTELADRIGRFSAARGDWRDAALQGRCRVIDRFDHDERVARLRSLYLEVAGSKGG